MDLDAVMLARIQFAFTIAFHIIFPAFTIGLSAWIATLLVMWVLPLATLGLGLVLWRALHSGAEWLPFIATVGVFLLSFIGLGISNAPYLVPPTLTIWDTAAHPDSQLFLLVGVVFLLPIILGYVVFQYWTFRGKVRPGEGYH